MARREPAGPLATCTHRPGSAESPPSGVAWSPAHQHSCLNVEFPSMMGMVLPMVSVSEGTAGTGRRHNREASPWLNQSSLGSSHADGTHTQPRTSQAHGKHASPLSVFGRETNQSRSLPFVMELPSSHSHTKTRQIHKVSPTRWLWM